MGQPQHTFVISGQGQWLAKEIIQAKPGDMHVTSVNELWNCDNPHLAGAATAYALAQLAAHYFSSEAKFEASH